jgi:hypothetical protein
MQILLDLPEEIVRGIGSESVGRAILESFVIEGVRSARISRGQARRALGKASRFEVDEFLKAHGVPVQESLEEVHEDSDRVLALGRK